MASTLTLADAKVELNKLIKDNQVQYNSGIIGCCKNYFVTFPNDSQKYKYNINKLISNKLRNKISSHLYNMSPKSSKQNTPTITDKKVKTIQRAVRLRQRKTKAVKTIATKLRNVAKLKVSEIKEAFNGKAKSVTIKPQYMGKYVDNIEYVTFKAYSLAKKQIPTTENYSVYGECSFKAESDDGSIDKYDVTSKKQNKKSEALMYTHLRQRIYAVIQSDQRILMSSINFTFHFVIIPSGGAASVSRDKVSILNKTSVNRVVNDDNNCFWYALVMLVYAKHAQIKQIKMGRKIRKTLAIELCEYCEMEWDKPVSFDDIPKVEEKLKVHIMILDIDNIPVLKTTTNLYHSLMYKNDTVRSSTQYYLLYDNNHYHSINNIKGFLAVEYFCPCCLHGYHNKKSFDTHICNDCDDGVFSKQQKKQVKSSKIGKDLSHYLNTQEMKGGKQEIEQKIKQVIKMLEKNDGDIHSPDNQAYLKRKRIDYTNKIEHQKYIIYDYETDVHTCTHKPNHVEAEVLTIGDTHIYNDCLGEQFSYSGYDVVDKFCNWLFTEEHSNSTVIAHNGAGYDCKFILQWCLKKNLHPSKYIRQGNRIMYMDFKKYHIRFIDSLHFFLEPLKNLSKTYNIDTVKGFFPHFFNKPENQNYIGSVPAEEMYGSKNLTTNVYYKEFKPWYDKIVSENKNDWDFKNEMKKYCRADVELLSKSVLSFRKMFKDKLDIDPFRYVTLASLCMAIFRGCFLPEKSIVANEQNKPISKVCNEWLIHLNDDKLIPEVPIFIDKNSLNYNTDQLHKDKLDGDTTTYYQQNTNLFTTDALCKKEKIIKEFNGCKWHGCPKCYPECKAKYNRTMERKNILELAGYRVDTIWECEWNKIKKSLPNKTEIEDKAEKQNIKPRDALFGGRTEGFKSYVKCNDHQKIYYLDVVSLYPTVNALDDYAVGFKKYVDVTIDDIKNNKFIGLVKCDVTPPKDLYVPVLPDNTGGKLLFH